MYTTDFENLWNVYPVEIFNVAIFQNILWCSSDLQFLQTFYCPPNIFLRIYQTFSWSFSSSFSQFEQMKKKILLEFWFWRTSRPEYTSMEGSFFSSILYKKIWVWWIIFSFATWKIESMVDFFLKKLSMFIVS